MRNGLRMASLHLSKVAVGCGSIGALRRRQAARLHEGMVPLTTRYRPKRAEELVGGSIYWIIKHRIAVRQLILGFGQARDGRTVVHLDPELIGVRSQPKRAHQGWRYLAPTDAPPDLEYGEDGLAELPEPLAERLALLALI